MPKSATDIPGVPEILADLQAKASEATRRIYAKHGDKVLGVKMGDLRAMAKPLKKQHALGLALWEAGWLETRILATLVLDPRLLSEPECIRLLESCESPFILDKLTDYVLAETPVARALQERWLDSEEPLLGRAGWNLMTKAVERDKAGAIDLEALMAKIEAELPAAARPKKEAMNTCLVMIGVYHPAYTEQAIAAGERLGRWDDRPIPKGCTSSYPPEWIPAAIALRKKR